MLDELRGVAVLPCRDLLTSNHITQQRPVTCVRAVVRASKNHLKPGIRAFNAFNQLPGAPTAVTRQGGAIEAVWCCHPRRVVLETTKIISHKAQYRH